MTLYVLRENGTLVEGPVQWNPGTFNRHVKGKSFAHDPPGGTTTFGTFTLLEVPDRPAFDPDLQTCSWDDANTEWDVAYKGLATLKEARIKEAMAIAEAGITSVYPLYTQINASLNIITGSAKTAIVDHVTAWREACQDHETAINALTTATAVAGYDLTTGWPE